MHPHPGGQPLSASCRSCRTRAGARETRRRRGRRASRAAESARATPSSPRWAASSRLRRCRGAHPSRTLAARRLRRVASRGRRRCVGSRRWAGGAHGSCRHAFVGAGGRSCWPDPRIVRSAPGAPASGAAATIRRGRCDLAEMLNGRWFGLADGKVYVRTEAWLGVAAQELAPADGHEPKGLRTLAPLAISARANGEPRALTERLADRTLRERTERRSRRARGVRRIRHRFHLRGPSPPEHIAGPGGLTTPGRISLGASGSDLVGPI